MTDRTQRRAAKHTTKLAERGRRILGETLDFVDSVRRRRMAARVLKELIAGRISHGTAAVRMRQIVGRTKGAWMLRDERSRTGLEPSR